MAFAHRNAVDGTPDRDPDRVRADPSGDGHRP